MAQRKILRQDAFAGTEQERIPALEVAGTLFAKAKRTAAAAAKDRKNKEAKLAEALQEHKAKLNASGDGKWSYVSGGFKLVLSEKDKVECTVPGGDADADA